MPEREATEGAASHLTLYWTPKMIREIIAFADQGHSGLNAIAARAVESLKQKRDGRLGTLPGPMPRWPRPPNLLRLFVGQHIINGASVGLGVVAVALVSSAIFGFAAGQPATLGAISASISDLPAPWREKAKTLGFGFALALLSTVAIQLALPWPVAALVMIGVISFVGGLVTGLGRWAVAVGMQAVIPMVFILGFPRETFPAAVRIEMLLAGGGVAYIAFALLATVFTDASARRMVASESIREFSIYMRAVAGVFDPDQELAAAYGATIRQQSMLSEQLQSARSLLLDRPGEKGERMRLAASIGILLDALDALVAAQCDVELIRQTPAAATVLARIGDALRVGSLDLEHLSLELLTTGHPILPPDHQLAIDALKREAARVEAESDGPESACGARRHDLATRPLAQPYPAPGAGLVGRRDGARLDRRRQSRRLHPETPLRAERAHAPFEPRIRRCSVSPCAWRWR